MKTWQFVLGGAAVALVLGMIGQNMGSGGAIPEKERWFSGGTLHDQTGRAWTEATPENRLATAADWTMAYTRNDALARPENLAVLRRLSEEVVVCIDTAAADGGSILDVKASEMAVVCMSMMGYERQS